MARRTSSDEKNTPTNTAATPMPQQPRRLIGNRTLPRTVAAAQRKEMQIIARAARSLRRRYMRMSAIHAATTSGGSTEFNQKRTWPSGNPLGQNHQYTPDTT